ncbi:MAG: hypothetical protein JXR83_15565 [Deltaproteobacteria bacterium]|nr:hypothetical protein [Deltaproteobacteria bacterium]
MRSFSAFNPEQCAELVGRKTSAADDAAQSPAVEHLLLDDKKLYAVSELGDPEVWDLGVLYLSRCELLQQVWSKVPSVWEGGRSVVRAPAAIGECVPLVTAASSRPGP